MEKKRNKEKRKKLSIYDDNVVGYVFAAPFIFGFVCFSLIPICMSLGYSFTDYSLGSKKAVFVGLENFLRLFKDEVFTKSILKTLQYVFISVPVKLSFALLVAFVLTRKSKLVTLYRSLYYVPSLVGGSVLGNLGLSKINWFGDEKLAIYPLILMAAWQFGSSMIIFAAGLKEIPSTYYEAAEIDGANGFQRFVKITLPCLSPIILYNLVMQTIAAFMTFTQAFVITGGGPNNGTMLYALNVYNQAFRYNHMGYACAMSWVMLVVMSIITLLIFRSSKFWVFNAADS